MKSLIRTCLATTVVGIFLQGCLTVPADEQFEAVKTHVQDRAGVSLSRPSLPAKQAVLPPQLRQLLKGGLTSEEAVRIAILNNGSLLASYANLDAASAQWLQMRLLPNPEAAATVLISEHEGDKRVWEVGADWNVLDVILLPLRRKLADNLLSAAQLQTTMAAMQLVYDVRKAYCEHQAAQQEYDLRSETTQSAEAAYLMAQKLREAGNIKELDLIQQRALYEQLKVDLSAAKFTVVETREALNRLLGLWGEDATWTVSAPLPDLPGMPLDTTDLEYMVIENSLDLGIARSRILAQGRRLGIARVQSLIPALHLGVDAEREPDDTWLVGPMISMQLPAFDFGQAKRPEAMAALRQRWHAYGKLAVDIRAAARVARDRAGLARDRVAYYRDVLLPLRKRITHRTKLQYNAMQLGVFQLIRSKQMELEAGRQYIRELKQYWLARNDLEQLMSGRLVSPSGADMSVQTPMAGGEQAGGGH